MNTQGIVTDPQEKAIANAKALFLIAARLLLLLIAFSSLFIAAPLPVSETVSAAPLPSQPVHRQPSPAEQLITESTAYPVEFQAYVLFNTYSHLPPQVDRLKLLRTLFEAATGAQLSSPVRSISPFSDDAATYSQRVSTLGLDRLSIQLRVIQLALSADFPTALSLFQQVVYPVLVHPLAPRALLPTPLAIIRY